MVARSPEETPWDPFPLWCGHTAQLLCEHDCAETLSQACGVRDLWAEMWGRALGRRCWPCLEPWSGFLSVHEWR